MSQLGMVKMMQEIIMQETLNPGSLKADSQGFQINWPQTIAASAELKKNPANIPVLPSAPCAGCIVPPREFRIREQKLTSSGPSLHSSLAQDRGPCEPHSTPCQASHRAFWRLSARDSPGKPCKLRGCVSNEVGAL